MQLGAFPLPKFSHEAGSNPFIWTLNTKVHFSSTLYHIVLKITVLLFKCVLVTHLFFRY